MINLINDYCAGCSEKGTENCTTGCIFNQLKANLQARSVIMNSPSPGCYVCTDKKGKIKEVFYDNPRGGLGIAEYCPNCGKKI